MPIRPRFRPLVKPPLTVDMILAWADEFHRQRGRFPIHDDGIVPGELTQTWCGIDNSLRSGTRGLPGGDTLTKLLVRYRGHRHKRYCPRLAVNQILLWADAHRRRTGEWPTRNSGPVADVPGETWAAIDGALHVGGRGLRGGTSLADILRAAVGGLDRRILHA